MDVIELMAKNGPCILQKRFFNVFGRHLLVTREDSKWLAFYVGNEGKSRRAIEIVIPSDVQDDKLKQYLADLCHEWATKQNPSVTREN